MGRGQKAIWKYDYGSKYPLTKDLFIHQTIFKKKKFA